MSTEVVGALVGAAVCVLAAPYLARLTRSVPDREQRLWLRGRPVARSRTAAAGGIGAVLGALAGTAAGFTALLPALTALALFAVPLVLIDVEHHRLPDRLVVPLAAVAIVLLGAAALSRGDWPAWLHAVEGAAAVFAALFMLAFAAPKAFGFGDVKLGAVLGGYLGWFGWAYVYYGIFAGFLLGALVGVAVLVSRRGSMKTAIPFGPMLIVGALLVLAFALVPSLGGS